MSALGENRTHILSFGGLRAIRCTTRAEKHMFRKTTLFYYMIGFKALQEKQLKGWYS
jgi:hypothetical protein